MQLNRVSFCGFLGQDAKKIPTKTGMEMTAFSLCSTEKGQNGRPDVQTWINVKVFGKWCEYAITFKKGDNVFVDGRLQVGSYKDKNGVERSSVDVIPSFIAMYPKSDSRPITLPEPQYVNDEYIPF